MSSIPVDSRSIALSSFVFPEPTSAISALVRLELPTSIPFAIGNTPPASTIARVRLVDGKSAFVVVALVVTDGGRRRMADPQRGHIDFWRARGAREGLRAPTPIVGCDTVRADDRD